MGSWKKALMATVRLEALRPLARVIYYLVLIALGYSLGFYESCKKKVVKAWKSRKKWVKNTWLRLFVLALSVSFSSWSLWYNREGLVVAFNNTSQYIKQSWKEWFVPQMKDLVTAVYLTNSSEQDSLSVVAVFLLKDNEEAFEQLRETPYDKALSDREESYAFIGSGSFIRTSLWSRQSNVVLSAAHVCVLGAGYRNLARSGEDYSGFPADSKYRGLFLGLKTMDGKTYRPKKMSLDFNDDVCKLEMEEVSENSIPLKMLRPKLSVHDSVRIYAVLSMSGIVSTNGLYSHSARISLPISVLCDPVDSVIFLQEIFACASLPWQCSDRAKDVIFSQPDKRQSAMYNLYVCTLSGVSYRIETVPTMRINGIVHSGYSGGPVLNTYGQVIGVTSAKSSVHIDSAFIAYAVKLIENDRDATWDYVLDDTW